MEYWEDHKIGCLYRCAVAVHKVGEWVVRQTVRYYSLNVSKARQHELTIGPASVCVGLSLVAAVNAIMEDGKQISGQFHRHVVAPGADVSAEDAKVQAIAASIHTPEVIAAYVAA